jgi:hypothetical protein
VTRVPNFNAFLAGKQSFDLTRSGRIRTRCKTIIRKITIDCPNKKRFWNLGRDTGKEVGMLLTGTNIGQEPV